MQQTKYTALKNVRGGLSEFMRFWKSDTMWWIRNLLMPIIYTIGFVIAVVVLIVLVLKYPQPAIVNITGEPARTVVASTDSFLLQNSIQPSFNASAPNGEVSKGLYLGWYNAYFKRLSRITKVKQPGEVSPKMESFFIRNATGHTNLGDDGFRVSTLAGGAWKTCYSCLPSGLSVPTLTITTLTATSITTTTLVASTSITTFDVTAVNSVIANNGQFNVGLNVLGPITGTSAAISGPISGTTGTFSGAVSAASYGAITGTSAIISGGVSGTTGTFSGAVSSGGTLSGTGLMIIGSASIVGSLGVSATVSGNDGLFTSSVVTNNGEFSIGVNSVTYSVGALPTLSSGAGVYVNPSTLFGAGARYTSYAAMGHVFTSSDATALWPVSPPSTLNMMMWDGAMAFQNAVAHGSFSSPSDERLKKDIRDVDEKKNELKFMSIEMKTYKFIDGYGSDRGEQLSPIAQQAIKAVPEMRGVDIPMKDGDETITRLTIRPDRLYALGMVQVKYLTKRVVKLEIENAMLLARLAAVEEKLGLNKN